MGNRELWARYDELVTAYERTRKQLGELREKLDGLRGEAQSPDGLVSATVGARGELTRLTLSPRTYRHLGPDELAETIVAAVRQAGANLAEQAGELYAPFLPKDVSYAQVRAGEADPAAFRPREPLTADTFTDWWGQLGVAGGGRRAS